VDVSSNDMTDAATSLFTVSLVQGLHNHSPCTLLVIAWEKKRKTRLKTGQKTIGHFRRAKYSRCKGPLNNLCAGDDVHGHWGNEGKPIIEHM